MWLRKLPVFSPESVGIDSEVLFSVSKPFVSETDWLVAVCLKISEAGIADVAFNVEIADVAFNVGIADVKSIEEVDDVIGFGGKAVVKLSEVKSIKKIAKKTFYFG